MRNHIVALLCLVFGVGLAALYGAVKIVSSIDFNQ